VNCHICTHLLRSRLALIAGIALSCAGFAAAQTLSMVSGNGQLLLSQYQSLEPLVVLATGSNGAPAAGVTVNWNITSGTGSLQTLSNTTDANGLASTFFTGYAGDDINSTFVAIITASAGSSSVNFTATTVPNAGNLSITAPKPNDNQTFTGQSGTTIPDVAEVQIGVQGGFVSGTGIPNVGVTVASYPDQTVAPPASCNAPQGTVLTDSNGSATCNLLITGPAGTSQLIVIIGGSYESHIFNLTITGGTACTYALSAANESFAAAGGSGSVTVSTTSACSWTAVSNVNYIGITAGASGTGNGTVSFNVAANTGAARSGALTIAGKTFTVNQSAANAPGGGLTVTTSSLPAGTVGSTYPGATLMATGGTSPYTWSVSGSLPSGLSLTPSTGAINGTPQSAGVFGFTANVRDSANNTASQSLSITINGASSGGFVISNVSFANGMVGQAYSQPLTASNFCTTPFQQNVAFSVISGALPTGLKLTYNANGTQSITGTPQSNGAFQFTLQATDACGKVATMAYTITISATGVASQQMTVNTQSLAFMAQIGSAAPPTQSFNIAASSGTLTYSIATATTTGANWLVTQGPSSGSTPGSLTVGVGNFSNLTPGPYNGSITITSGASNSPVVIPVTLTVAAGPTLVLQSPASMTVNQVASPSQSATPVTQEQIVLASGVNSVSFTVAASTTDGNHWLIALPASGTTPATITASINTGGLAIGKYTGTVTITPSSGAPVTVTITANVTQDFPAPSSVVNGASFLSGAVSPGEIVTIFGTQLGPVTPATLQLNASGEVASTLGGTQVFFDGTPAPMIYASSTQISVIVPYEIAGQTTTSVSVEYLTLKSSSISVPVATSAPGIFVLGGTSQGAILDQNFTVNGPANPAAVGSIIQIFATGEGQTNPAGVDGFVAQGPIAMPLLKVTAQINGEDAQVVYAGAAPGEPSGVIQVNVMIPSDVPHGGSVPVTIKVGTVFSQPGVTVAIAP
jgi:trimeric autotransporter adhesin